MAVEPADALRYDWQSRSDRPTIHCTNKDQMGERTTVLELESPYSLLEERIHSISHGVGAVASIVGLLWMLYVAIGAADPWRIVASSIYGASLIVLFTSSMLYHGLHSSSWRHFLKLLDHCVIYILIAGSYTPFLLVQMRTPLGWSLFVAIWTLAVAGIVTKLFFKHRFPWWSLASYLLMGWLIVFAAPQLADSISGQGLAWLVAGGIFYTVGALFYASKRISYGHAIWHFFVLAGAASHFFAVIWHVLPVEPALA